MKGAVVADCSACAGWFLRDESSRPSEKLLREVMAGKLRLMVPDLWWSESLNVLCNAVRRGRITDADARRTVYYLEEIPIETISAQRIGRQQIFALARQHALSAYDATYLALAEAQGVPLITCNRHLLALRKQFAGIRPLA